jgi:UDP-GlcNAc:undecaprenyl-phosphate/decaprenyl-phosphate GlcNAc-1-phosphate transferase
MSLLLLWAVTAAAASATLVPLARRAAFALGAIDVPDERHQHGRATARLGGIAVFGAFALVFIVLLAAGRVAGSPSGLSLPIFFGTAILVLAAGAIDDVRRLRAHVKLAVEIGAAVIVVYAGNCRITGISSPGGVVELGWLAGPFTVVWIVLVTNAINLVDGIDGLAAGTSILALGSVAIIAHGFDLVTVATLAAVLAGACAGFLIHNFHPATIFLGDSGSLFIGFTIGVLSSYARAKGTTGAITIATLLIVALPLGDTLSSIGRRYFKGLAAHSLRSHLAGLGRIFTPDNNHLHHRLLRAGLGHRGATYALYFIQAIACAYAIYLLVR